MGKHVESLGSFIKDNLMLGAADVVAAEMVDVGSNLNVAIGQSPAAAAKTYWDCKDAS